MLQRGLGAASSPPSIDLDIAPFGPSKLPQSRPECCDEGLPFPITFRISHQHANASDPVGRLRPRCDRSRDRNTADHRDEIPPLHAVVLRCFAKITDFGEQFQGWPTSALGSISDMTPDLSAVC